MITLVYRHPQERCGAGCDPCCLHTAAFAMLCGAAFDRGEDRLLTRVAR